MKSEQNSTYARIGMVHYINTAPIHEIWKERSLPDNWILVEEHPAALNQMLARGDIDLGFVSSHEYGIRPDDYRILADLSISANGPVGSVFLFSRIKAEKLAGLPVLLSSESKTSVCLTRIILESFFNVRPQYITGAVRDARLKGAEAVLAIGDDAIRLKVDGSYQYCLDLGEVWQLETGLPFVFAVCAVREDFYRRQPQMVGHIHRELIDCRDQGIRQLQRICEIAAPRIPMEITACHSYLKAIEYDLDESKMMALERFFSYLKTFGEASAQVLPLKILDLSSE